MTSITYTGEVPTIPPSLSNPAKAIYEKLSTNFTVNKKGYLVTKIDKVTTMLTQQTLQAVISSALTFSQADHFRQIAVSEQYFFIKNFNNNLELISFEEMISNGSTFANIFSVIHINTGKELAMKIPKQQTPFANESIINEFHKMNLIRSIIDKVTIPVMQLLRVKEAFESYTYLMEKYPKLYKDLIQETPVAYQVEINSKDPRAYSITYNENPAPFDYVSRLPYFYQLLFFLKTLYVNNLAHRDIKPDNILVKPGKDFSSLHIADWTSAISKEDIIDGRRIHCYFTKKLTPYKEFKLANQYISETDGTKAMVILHAIDVFAMGQIFYLSLQGVYPYLSGEDKYPIMEKYKWQEISERYAPSEINDLIMRMIDVNYKVRITADVAFTALDEFIQTKHPALHDKIKIFMNS